MSNVAVLSLAGELTINMRNSAVVAALALCSVVFSGAAIAATLAAAQMSKSGMTWFGGPIYSGAPALDVTAALVKA